jgi:RNA polymerase sigma factor (sigma-70 family)
MQRLLIDDYRKQRQRRHVVSADAVELAARPEYEPPPWEHVDLPELEAAVDRLPPSLAVTFRLRVFDQLPGAVVGERLGIPLCTVHTRLLRARRRLRELLTERPLSARQAPRAPGAGPS